MIRRLVYKLRTTINGHKEIKFINLKYLFIQHLIKYFIKFKILDINLLSHVNIDFHLSAKIFHIES